MSDQGDSGKKRRKTYAPRISFEKPTDIPLDVPVEAAREEFGRRVRNYRLKKGWNQSELARAATTETVRVTRDEVSKYEKANHFPGHEKLEAVAKALGVTAEDLMPTKGLTAKADRTPPFEMRATADGRVWLRVNQAVSYEAALKIMALLKGDETE